MNEQKIAFIYCYNDERMLNESILYIQSLNIPPGFEIEIIPIEDASSITAGYNFAMSQTDAKYKVFLHQDVFIINKNFINAILEVFRQEESIGLIGMVGDKSLPTNFNLWQEKQKFGKVYESHFGNLEMLVCDEVGSHYEEVQAIEGFLMVTQYDIPWREDLFDEWCFYNNSQSLEFIRKGFKVAVPFQATPWCIHDCQNDQKNEEYDKYKSIFIDEYTDVFEKILSKTPTLDLFDFDKVRAKQIIDSNKVQFMGFLNNANNSLNDRNYEQASRWIYEAAKFASENHPGLYTSNESERILIECAKNLPDAAALENLNITRNNQQKKRRVLHIISEGYVTGGHTRLVKNWVAKDKDSVHSLITTWQLQTSPEWLLNEIKHSGGWIYSLEEKDKFIERASELRKIAYEWADIVVLHVHMFDPIPIMAFGVEGGPPVLFMNHGDHVFWIGKTIIDYLINFRASGLELSLNRRGISNNAILPIPLTLPTLQSKDKSKIRETLGISEEKIVLLTIATPYKFNSFGEIHYIDIIKRMLNIHEDVIAIVIGPNNAREWERAYKETNGRILPLGMRQDIEEFYCISDIYVDSYMFGSVTSALDGGLTGLPIVALENKHNKTLSFNDISYSYFNKEFHKIEDYLYYVNKLIINKEFRECEGRQLSHKIKEDHIDNWTKKLNEIYSDVEYQVHKVYLKNEIEYKQNNE
ncbi:glycosyltransferase, partial [Bacillus sp. JJ1503]|uniref:glycosyltransferase n=2 Tax=unclassified Bacillus (in: firmicutes) TaxID=185979 RepID=UPI002FFD9BCD